MGTSQSKLLGLWCKLKPEKSVKLRLVESLRMELKLRVPRSTVP
jgi:hypothetical protein